MAARKPKIPAPTAALIENAAKGCAVNEGWVGFCHVVVSPEARDDPEAALALQAAFYAGAFWMLHSFVAIGKLPVADRPTELAVEISHELEGFFHLLGERDSERRPAN